MLDRAVEGAQLHPPDKAGNTYLSKGKSHTRIDPLIDQVMAVGFCCDPPVAYSGAYSDASTGVGDQTASHVTTPLDAFQPNFAE